MPSSPNLRKSKDYSYKDTKKSCELCNEPLTIRNTRDVTRKRFCSNTCRGKAVALTRSKEEKLCKVCGSTFQTKAYTGLFCSKTCSTSYSVKSSYSRMDNNPREYFKHLLYKKGRQAISLDFLLGLLEAQQGLCAITGQVLTFSKVPNSGRINTNASIDQKVAGGGYTEANVQIVCDVVNRMKIDMTQTELEFWCRKIIGD